MPSTRRASMQKFELGTGSARSYKGFLTLPGQATRQAGQEEDRLAALARRKHEGFNSHWTLVMARVRDGAAGPAR